MFKLAYVAIPVHIPAHWYAIGIDVQRRTIAVIDSLRPMRCTTTGYRDILGAVRRCAVGLS